MNNELEIEYAQTSLHAAKHELANFEYSTGYTSGDVSPLRDDLVKAVETAKQELSNANNA